MATEIKCPKCGHEFAMEDAMSEELKQKLEKEKTDFGLVASGERALS